MGRTSRLPMLSARLSGTLLLRPIRSASTSCCSSTTRRSSVASSGALRGPRRAMQPSFGTSFWIGGALPPVLPGSLLTINSLHGGPRPTFLTQRPVVAPMPVPMLRSPSCLPRLGPLCNLRRATLLLLLPGPSGATRHNVQLRCLFGRPARPRGLPLTPGATSFDGVLAKTRSVKHTEGRELSCRILRLPVRV